MTLPVPFSGGCACGAVRYTAHARPIAQMICHCRDCQRGTGAGGAPVVLVATDAVTITGAPRWYPVTADNGHTVRRAFCAECGCPLFADGTRGPYLAIKAGSLDDPGGFRPTLDIWTDRAQPWDPPAPGRRHVPKDP